MSEPAVAPSTPATEAPRPAGTRPSSTGATVTPIEQARRRAGARTYPGKRAFDVLGSLLLLVLAAPLLALCALALKLGCRGPVLFGHRRCGRHGEPFDCLKFRTMVVGAEEWLDEDGRLRAEHRNNGFKLPSDVDPRVTRVGRLLRKTYLDELPQLVNVLRGEMSLVGPRPIVEEELELYGDRTRELLSVRPGIFGPWTALGRRRPCYPERCEVELSYGRDASLHRDVGLLARNLGAALRGQ